MMTSNFPGPLPSIPIERPPLGLRPRSVFEEQLAKTATLPRAREIAAAIVRYSRVDKPIPTEWAEELVDRLIEVSQ